MGTWGNSSRARRATSHPLLVVMVAGALIAAGCSNRDEAGDTTPPTTAAPTTAPPGTDTPPTAAPDTAAPDTGTPDTGAPVTDAPATDAPAATDAPGVMFGDLPSPCGAGDATIADTGEGGQNGGQKLVLATATDKGAEIAPGINQEMYDAAVAFADWCNEQGGIAGLPIEVMDADAKLFDVPATIERICDKAFAMVGGGLVFDDQEFPRFHECGMIDFSGYTVTTAKAMSNGKVQPLPNPSDKKNALTFQWAKENHPDDVAHFATLYGDVLTTQIVEQQYIEEMGIIGGYEVVDRIPYNPTGEANWAPFAQRLKDNGVRALTFVGSPEPFAPLLKAMDDIGFEPGLIVGDANFYAPVLIDRAGDSAEGMVVRIPSVPFEEAERSPAMTAFLDMMSTYNPDGKIGQLGVAAVSSYLLFATAANACLADNGNVLERECVLAAGTAITEWTGGGLHVPSNPGSNAPSPCAMLVTVRNGGFERLYPELGGPDDDGNGFTCDPAQIVDLTGDYGDVNAGVDPDRAS